VGRNVLLLTASVMLATLVREHDLRLGGGQLDAGRPLPGTLDPFGLRFEPGSS
jgi:hypothetical protein